MNTHQLFCIFRCYRHTVRRKVKLDSLSVLVTLNITLISLFSYPISASAATWNIIYPRPVNDQHVLSTYPVEVLDLALSRTGVNYRLASSDRIMLKAKALRQLSESREVNVVWSQTDEQREGLLLPIRIPIAKGLIGWRILLIESPRNDIWRKPLSIEGIRKLTSIQGDDWPDTTILRANGFNVITESTQNDRLLFDLLRSNRGDYFPRSVLEVWKEINDKRLTEGLEVEENMVLHYPTAIYFFVNKTDITLARLISEGLKRTIEDGSFNALFETTFSQYIEDAKLDKRTVLTLDNPLLTSDTPLEQSELWYFPPDAD